MDLYAKDYYSIQEAAQILGINYKTMYQKVSTGAVNVIRRFGTTILVPAAELDAVYHGKRKAK